MDKIKLKDILVWLPKSSLKAGEGLEKGEFPFFTSSQQISKFYNDVIYDDECLIYGTGGNPSIHYYKGAFATSTDCFVTKLKSAQFEINFKYVFYFLKTNIAILERGFKGVVIRHLSKTYLENIEINIPPIDEQNRIVTLLDKVEAIILNKNESLRQIDNLVNSIFYDTFGSKFLSPSSYEGFPLDEFIIDIQSGTSYNGSETNLPLEINEFGVLKTSAVSKGFFDAFQYKVFDKSNAVKKNIFPQKGDLLINRANTIDLVAMSCIVDDDYSYLVLPDKIWKIILDESKLKKSYLHFILNSKNYRSNIRRVATGSTGSMLNISMDKFKKLVIPLADYGLQEIFDLKFSTIQEKKKKILHSKEHLELLLKSLTQRIFSGQSQIDIDTELEAIINTINLELPDEENNIDNIIKDMAYRQKLIDKLATHSFIDIHQYDKAKYIAFRLLKENKDKIAQEFDNTKKQVILT